MSRLALADPTLQPRHAPSSSERMRAVGPQERPHRVVNVQYTGLGGRPRYAWEVLFDPPLSGVLASVCDALGRHPAHIALALADPGREPPWMNGAVVILSGRQGEGRWPLAYLIGEDRALTLTEVEAALFRLRAGPPSSSEPTALKQAASPVAQKEMRALGQKQ